MSHIEAAPRSNPGETLRQAREEKGWDVAEVARQLNLTPHSLAQLEAGEFERLPGHTFSRGYVRAYAKLLGMDQSALVEQFDHYTGTNASGSTVHSLGHVPEPLRLSRTVLRLVSAVLLLLLLSLCYFWWQERPERLADLGAFGLKHIEVESADGTTVIHPLEEPEDSAVAEALKAEEPVPVDLAPAQAGEPQTAAAPDQSEPVAAEAPAAPAPAPAAAAPADPLPAAAAPLAVTPAASAPSVAPISVAEGEGLVQVSFSADCWAQVSDANGRVLVSTVKHKGESLQVAGKAPLELRLGFARGAQVTYNGEPVNLRNVTSGGTARVTLGQ